MISSFDRSPALAAVVASLVSGLGSAQVTVGPPMRVDGGRGTSPCNGTTISLAASNPLHVVAAWNDFRDGPVRLGVGVSLDGGLTWTDGLLRAPLGHQSNFEGDAMSCYDQRTGTLWVGGVSFYSNQGGLFVSRLNAAGSQLGAPVMARVANGVDKGRMAAGVHPTNPNKSIVYCAYSEGLIRSLDLGDTWSDPISLGQGLGFTPRTGPGGMLYVAYYDFVTQMLIRRSFTGGATIGPPRLVANRLDSWGIDGSRVPGNARVLSLAGLAVDQTDGTLYYVYPDTTSIESNGYNLDVYFTKSTDQALHWTTPVVVNSDSALPADQFFPWVETDAQGRLHMIFYDSRSVVQDDTDPVGFFDAYYSYSDDQGDTWTEIRLTASPLRTDDAFPNGTFIGDYIGLTTGGHRTLPLYMDTRQGNSDIFTHLIQDGPATEFCYGLGCHCGNNDPDAGCGNFGLDGVETTGSHLSASGSSSAASDDLVLAFDGLKSHQFGTLFASSETASAPFGDGMRCVAGALTRFPLRQADAAGTLVYGPGEIVGLDGAVAGTTRYYQGWYRDPLGPCLSGFNVSNAVSVTWQ